MSKLALQRLIDQKDHGTTRCTPHDRDPTTGIQPSNPPRSIDILGDRKEFGGRSSFLMKRVRVVFPQLGLSLHGGFDAIRGEEDDIVTHPCAGSGQDQFPRAQILFAQGHSFARQWIGSGASVFSMV